MTVEGKATINWAILFEILTTDKKACIIQVKMILKSKGLTFMNKKMKISEVTEEFLLSLSPKQKFDIICGAIKDDGDSADIAILLGSRPTNAKERALAAAKLYRDGRVKYIVPSGGVEWDVGDGEMLSEALYMKRILEVEGVPSEAIILENEARTTKENMIYATLQINRRTKFYGDKRVIIVTSLCHMKRSIALANAFLPRMVTPSAYPSYPYESVEEWIENDKNVASLDGELHLIWGLVNHNIISDFEIEI